MVDRQSILDAQVVSGLWVAVGAPHDTPELLPCVNEFRAFLTKKVFEKA